MADYHHDLAEKFLRSYPDGPFDYGTIGAFLKAAKTNNIVRGVYLALEKLKGGPLPCISASEQAHVANQERYQEIADKMAKQAAQPPIDYAAIREYLDAKRNNNTVKGVYKELAKLQAEATCKEVHIGKTWEYSVGDWTEGWWSSGWQQGRADDWPRTERVRGFEMHRGQAIEL